MVDSPTHESTMASILEVEMTAYLLRRIVQIPFVIVVTSLVIFLLIHLTPGDPVNEILGLHATPEMVRVWRHKLGLDRPLHVQYLSWLWKASHGDLGQSIRSAQPVLKLILDRLPLTFVLITLAMLFSLAVSIPAGIISAWKCGKFPDYAVMFLTLIGISMPQFGFAIILIMVLALRLDLLPISGIGLVKPLQEPWRFAQYAIMPVLTLGLGLTALETRLLRSCMLDALSEEYIRVARAKGLREYFILTRHAFRNALIPLITVVATYYALGMGASIIVESIFGIPGLGSLLIEAVWARDIPVVQGCTFFIAIFFVVANLVADILYVYVDPRIRFQ